MGFFGLVIVKGKVEKLNFSTVEPHYHDPLQMLAWFELITGKNYGLMHCTHFVKKCVIVNFY